MIPITLLLFVALMGTQASAAELSRRAVGSSTSSSDLLSSILSPLPSVLLPSTATHFTTTSSSTLSLSSSSTAPTNENAPRSSSVPKPAPSGSATSSPETPFSSTPTSTFTQGSSSTPEPRLSSSGSTTASSSEITTLSTRTTNATTQESSTSSMPIPGPSGSDGNAKKMINLGAVIGGIIGAIMIALVFFVFLLWKCRKRQALLQKPFEVQHRVGAPDLRVSPYQKAISGSDESLPSIEQRIGLLSAPVMPDLVTKNSEDSSPLQANLKKASQRPSAENNGDHDQAEIIPAEHRPAQSALESAEPPEYNEETLYQSDLITYRHQDSGWRPVELRGDQNLLVGGREVIELPPNYSEAS